MIITAAVLAFALHTAVPADPHPRPAPQPSVSREEAAARGSRAQDMRGELPSLYRGRYFHADQETFRRCVAEREGMFQYAVRGGGGGNYYGTYQFSSAFQNGVPYMMAKESRRTKDGLVRAALALRSKPINQWSRYWQDRAWFTVMNFNGKWTGMHHWAGGRWYCGRNGRG